MRRRGYINWLGICSTTGLKNNGIRQHLIKMKEMYHGLEVNVDLFPNDDVQSDSTACKKTKNSNFFFLFYISTCISISLSRNIYF